MNKKTILLSILFILPTISLSSEYKNLATIVEEAKNPKFALEKLVDLIEKNPTKLEQKFFSQALTAIANKFPCSGYFLSYNLPVDLQKQFEVWYEDYSKKHPEEQIIKTIMGKMSTFHDELVKIPAAQVNDFIAKKRSEFKNSLQQLENLGVNLNRVVFCEELDHNLLSYAFTKDLDNPAAKQHLVSLILESSPDFNLTALDPQGKTFFGATSELYFDALKKTSSLQQREQLAKLITDVKKATDTYQK
ncbi:MAG: hypothetical protein ACOYT8_01975 [Candidatus Dependentiae bacterium]